MPKTRFKVIVEMTLTLKYLSPMEAWAETWEEAQKMALETAEEMQRNRKAWSEITETVATFNIIAGIASGEGEGEKKNE